MSVEELKRDAARYRWLRDRVCNQLFLSRDEGHATNYTTAREWIEQYDPESFTDCDPSEVEKMKETNTVWRLQVYPHTPVGFDLWHGASLDRVIDSAMDEEVRNEAS